MNSRSASSVEVATTQSQPPAVQASIVEVVPKQSTSDQGGRVIKLVVAMLVVLGLTSMVLTVWYWTHTSPKRGRTVSRARMAVGAGVVAEVSAATPANHVEPK